MDRINEIRINATPYRNGLFPGYWRDEQTDLPAAVEAFYNQALGKESGPTEHQLSRIQWYLEYFINAPIWDTNPYMDDDGRCALQQLRERVQTLASVESIRRWIDEAMEIGLDPL